MDEPTHPTNPYCPSSPVTDGRHVIAFLGSAGLHCFNQDGTLLWNRKLGSPQHLFGQGSSPLIHGNLVTLNYGPGEEQFWVTLDLATGEELWRLPIDRVDAPNPFDDPNGPKLPPGSKLRDPFGSWATPVLVRKNEREELLLAYPKELRAVDPKSGKTRWTCKELGTQVFCTPLIVDETVVCLGSTAMAVRLFGEGDVTETNRLWFKEEDRPRIGTGVEVNGIVIANTMQGVVEAIEMKSGKRLWQERLASAEGGGSWSSLVRSGERIFATNKDGSVYVFTATPEFQLLATNRLEETTNASPAIVGDRIYIRTDEHLWCIGPAISVPPINTPPIVAQPTSALQAPLPRRAVLGVPFKPVSPEQATQFKLRKDVGLVAMAPVPNLSAAKAGVKAGDIITALNGRSVGYTSIASEVRGLKSGEEFAITLLRDGATMELKSIAVEKPRDPGNSNYEVIYNHVVSHGNRIRTIMTLPKTAGKHPGFMFIQGFSPVSYDFTLEGSKGDVASMDGPLLYEFANSGFVTLRVEKPGVGDSEGGPFAELDYTTELDIYRQALKQLKERGDVDAENIFIFGHSMGAAFGPMIASENPVKGIAVYGAASRTWYEYLLDTLRYQGLVAGDSFENADEKVRIGSRLLALVFLENESVESIKKAHPELSDMADALFPNGLFNGKTLSFWRELGQINFAAYWAKCNARVFAVRGASDYVTYDVDHKLIADVVNRAHPGWGTSMTLPDSDHLFHKHATERESMQAMQKGEFNPAFAKRMKAWIDELISTK